MKDRRFKSNRFKSNGTKTYAAVIMLLFVCLTGCGINSSNDAAAPTNQADAAEASAFVKQPGIYDSEDVAIVVKKDMEAGTVQFQNVSTSRRYTLNYDGTTTLYDKNDQALSMKQLKEGSVVTVRFYKPDKSLSYVKENLDCISYSNVQNYSMDLKNGTIQIGGELYNISGHVVVVSDGRETDMMEVNQVDVLSVWGYKNMIYGIHVEKGHGYLRLQNEDYFVGGWIDVGDKVVRKVSEDMLLVVPEGTYNVTVSQKGSSATQEITFACNEEMAWDLGDVEITVVQKGNIIFTLNPVTAKVTIDGREVNVSKPVELEYGLHQMRVTADGYDTIAQYIKVAEPSANISVELEKSEEAAEEETSETPEKSSNVDTDSDEEPTGKKYQTKTSDDDEEEESSSKETEEESQESKSSVVSSSNKYRVYIDAPEGVELYLDGNYVGITPTSFNKAEGNYVVTLRKTGYQTRSYTLQIDNEEKDVNYSFTELVKLEDS
ncbi:MAG: PEGA domain-containing protein [Lachnospiraceae bacterium]|nr:PEGA domain-containing protein [Lachnospiraceae bacterium]